MLACSVRLFVVMAAEAAKGAKIVKDLPTDPEHRATLTNYSEKEQRMDHIERALGCTLESLDESVQKVLRWDEHKHPGTGLGGTYS